MAEIAFEYLAGALEATAGTAVDPPTHYLPVVGKVTPKVERYRPEENYGNLSEFTRSITTRKWSEFEGEGPADPYMLPFWLNTLLKGSVSVPTYPAGGVVGILDLLVNVVDGETVSIGADVYEVVVVNTDSAVDTAGGSWDVTTDPLTIDLAGMVGLVTVIAQGDLIRIENEILKCTGVVGTSYTFARGRCGTVAATHADAQSIFISAAPGAMSNIAVGLVTTLTPTAFALALVAEIAADGTEDVTAADRALGAATRKIEVVADTAQAVIVLAETLAGVGNAWRAGVATYLWEFAPVLTANDLRAVTLYWGDPNLQMFQTAYNQLDELTISADGSGTDGVTMSLKGMGLFPTKTTPASTPTAVPAPILLPSALQLWIDTALAIGTTEIEGEIISAEATIPSGIVRKFLPQGPGGNKGFSAVGRTKRHIEVKLAFELPDLAMYDHWDNEDVLKVRTRVSGDEIVSVGSPAVAWYSYVEIDCYGTFDSPAWGENEKANRTLETTLMSEWNAVAGRDVVVRVLSNRATL
jgi:hypothetical protein